MGIPTANMYSIFRGLSSSQEVLLTHGDTITDVAAPFRVTGKSGNLVSG